MGHRTGGQGDPLEDLDVAPQLGAHLGSNTMRESLFEVDGGDGHCPALPLVPALGCGDPQVHCLLPHALSLFSEIPYESSALFISHITVSLWLPYGWEIHRDAHLLLYLCKCGRGPCLSQ